MVKVSRSTGIVRPWGLMGSRYELSGWSLWLYRLNWVLFGAYFVIPMIWQISGESASFSWPVFVLLISHITVTSLAVTRMGTKLD